LRATKNKKTGAEAPVFLFFLNYNGRESKKAVVNDSLNGNSNCPAIGVQNPATTNERRALRKATLFGTTDSPTGHQENHPSYVRMVFFFLPLFRL
ncbi:MAG: hypothetical protein IJD59_05055, partial [Clostridia bacterium]|nr:hypothetical protein [Clostridia bacterium]